jgi:alcohol dehydrogenase class IV
VEGVVGFGGGSVMDVAKVVAYLKKTGGSLEEMYGVD